MMKTIIFLAMASLFSLFGCQHSDKVLKVAATPTPHAELLEVIKPDLAHEGIELKIVEVDDYNLPNRLLYENQVDANFFQHRPYLNEQNKRFGYNLVELTAVHYEPLGVYSHKIASLNDLNDAALVAIPCDPTNQARALILLEDLGLITLKPELHDNLATIYDIATNPKHLRFTEVDAAFLPRALDDVDIALIPVNFALQGKLNPIEDALALEAQGSSYSNIVVIRSEDCDRDDLKKLKNALHSEKVRQFIRDKYKGALLPAS